MHVFQWWTPLLVVLRTDYIDSRQHQRRSVGEVGNKSASGLDQSADLGSPVLHEEGQALGDDQGNVVVPRRHVPLGNRLAPRFRLPKLVRSVI
ncbi:hypothetical protein LOK49_LG13G00358 [Camellia lanceoleosa]|uniref:Uncharacterized protein n=1 Tax=Camellia lanceoleosa TaxID=1840588 RepID=A0ACC0FLA8_9ERIC|nr:hypothetical protein LOK49_LG13G00358 [Camellia lanceoleosa]